MSFPCSYYTETILNLYIKIKTWDILRCVLLVEIPTKEIRLSDVASAARSSVKDAPTRCQRYFSHVMNVSAVKIHGEGEYQIMLLGTSD